jgi:hypothetical protein
MTLGELSNHLLRPIADIQGLKPPSKLSSLVVGGCPRGSLGDYMDCLAPMPIDCMTP